MEADGGDHEAHVLGVLPAEDDNAADELAAAVLIHHGDEAVAELHFDGVHRQEGIYIVDILVELVGAGLGGLLRDRRCGGLGGCYLRLLLVGLGADEPPGDGKAQTHQEQRHMGRAGDAAQQGDDEARREDGLRLAQELPDHVVVEASVGHSPGNHHGGGCGDHQGGDLADQAVADGGDGVGLHRRAHLHLADGHAHNQSAHKVDGGDDEAQGGVALDELGSAVHGAVEVGFLLDLGPAGLGPLLVDEAGRKIRVDGHLLAGHGVQGEPGRHLGDALRALGHDDQLDQHDNQEDDDAQDDIPLGNHVAERQNDAAGVTVVAQNLPGGRNIQPQPEQGGNQQQGWEYGKIQRVRHRHGNHQDQHGQGDIDHQQYVQQRKRQRDDDKQDNDDYRERYAVLENSLHGRCPFQKSGLAILSSYRKRPLRAAFSNSAYALDSSSRSSFST